MTRCRRALTLALVAVCLVPPVTAQTSQENRLLGPTGASLWDLQAEGLPSLVSVSFVLQRNEAGALTATAMSGATFTEGEIWIEPDARRVVVGMMFEFPSGALIFGGGLSEDERLIAGRCQLGEQNAACQLARRPTGVEPPSS